MLNPTVAGVQAHCGQEPLCEQGAVPRGHDQDTNAAQAVSAAPAVCGRSGLLLTHTPETCSCNWPALPPGCRPKLLPSCEQQPLPWHWSQGACPGSMCGICAGGDQAGDGSAMLPSRLCALPRRHIHGRGCTAAQGSHAPEGCSTYPHWMPLHHVEAPSPHAVSYICRHGGNTWHAARARLGPTYPCVWHCRSALWGGQGGLPLSLRIGRRSLPCMEEVLHQM